MNGRRLAIGWLVSVILIAAPLLGACAPKGEVVKVVEKEVPIEKEVVKVVEKEVPVEKVVVKEVVKEVPVEEQVVKVVWLGTLSGRIATNAIPQDQGWRTYFRYINEEKGGINGVRVELVEVDTRYDIGLATTNFKRYVTDPKVKLMHVLGGHQLESMKPLFEREKMPAIAHSSGSAVIDPPGWIFSVLPPWNDVGAYFFDWVVEEDWKESRPPRVGILGIDHPTAYSHTASGTETYAKQKGIDIVGKEYVPGNALDFTAPLLRLKELGVDYLYPGHLEPTTAPMLKNAQQIGLLGNVKFVLSQFLFGREGLSMSGDLAEGVIYQRVVPLRDDEGQPGIKLALDMCEKFNGYRDVHDEYLVGWVDAMVSVEAIRMALEKVGYQKLTGADVKDAFEAMRGFDTGVLGKMNFDKEDRAGGSLAFMYEAKNGTFVRIPTKKSEVPDVYGMWKRGEIK